MTDAVSFKHAVSAVGKVVFDMMDKASASTLAGIKASSVRKIMTVMYSLIVQVDALNQSILFLLANFQRALFIACAPSATASTSVATAIVAPALASSDAKTEQAAAQSTASSMSLTPTPEVKAAD